MHTSSSKKDKLATEGLISDDEIQEVSDTSIGWFSAMCMVVGLMIGSGIFTTPAMVLANVGSTGLAVLLWLIGGIVSLCGAL